MFRRPADERGLVSGCPYLVSTRTAVQTSGLLAGVHHDEAAIERPRQHASKYGPGVIGLPAGGGGELVAPRQEDAAAPGSFLGGVEPAGAKCGTSPFAEGMPTTLTMACAKASPANAGSEIEGAVARQRNCPSAGYRSNLAAESGRIC